MTNPGIMRTILALQCALGTVEDPVTVRIVDHIVEISDPLLSHEVPQNIHIAVGFGISGEYVVVGNDNYLIAVPDLRGFAELAFENANGTWAADVVRHEHIGLDPNVFSGLH